MDDELKPCPFCGGDASLYGHYDFCVNCSNSSCDASVGRSHDDQWYDGAFETREAAVAAWNQRAERVGDIKPTTMDNKVFFASIHEYECMSCGELVIVYSGDEPKFCTYCGVKVVD